MNPPTKEQVKEAVDALSTVSNSGSVKLYSYIHTLLYAYKAEKERLDWLHENGYGDMVTVKAQVGDDLRSAIDALRKDKQ